LGIVKLTGHYDLIIIFHKSATTLNQNLLFSIHIEKSAPELIQLMMSITRGLFMNSTDLKSNIFLLGNSLIAAFISFAFSYTMDDYSGIVFHADHALNTPIDSLPVHPRSQNFINSIGANTSLHPDFGTQWDDDGTMRMIGIPYNLVGADQPLVPITFTLYDDESDPGPWPIPTNPLIETVFNWRDTDAGDRHMLIIDTSRHLLYETGNVIGNSDGTEWEGGCGAVFDLNSNDLRPAGWTSADAAGLPIFPLLIRYDEVSRALEKGAEIPHAIRFTASVTQKAYIWPARHYASSSTDVNRPPMGLRFRLKADYDISGFTPRMQVILKTFKKYGLIMADNGSNWYFQGTHDDRWDDSELRTLKKLRGSDFEAVDISPWMERQGFDPNSATVPQISPVRKPIASSLRNQEFSLQHKTKNGQNTFVIRHFLKKNGNISIKVTDLRGRKLLVLLRESKEAGENTYSFSAKLSPGVYLISLDCDKDFLATVKFTVTR